MYKRARNILRNNMLFIQPIFIYFFLFLTAVTFALTRTFYPASKFVLVLSLCLLTVAFVAGWLYINKLAVLDYKEEDTKEEIAVKSIKNFKQYFTGIGENFVNILLAFIILGLIYTLSVFAFVKGISHFIGEPKVLVDLPEIVKNATTQADIMNYLKSVSQDDKIIFGYWMMGVTILGSIMNYLGVLYFDIITYTKKNVLVSLWKTICFFFKYIGTSIGVIFFMFVLYMVLNFLSMLLGSSTFSMFLLIILFTLYLNYYIILVFCLYDEKTNSDNRTEFIG